MRGRGIFIRDVQRETARFYGVPLEAMSEPRGLGSNRHSRARPRQIAMCLSDRLTGKSSVAIGRVFNRDHSTVLHAISAAERRCLADDETKLAMRKITDRLMGRRGIEA